MARPREFDETTALNAATELFWARGYEGAGLSDLLSAMGLQRGSLYKAWGSKKGLFLACLSQYETHHIAPGLAILHGEGQHAALRPNARIDAVFAAQDPRGCLLCNTAAGVAGDDPEIAAWVRARLNALRNAFGAALFASGRPETPDALLAQYVGHRVQQRSAPAPADHSKR